MPCVSSHDHPARLTCWAKLPWMSWSQMRPFLDVSVCLFRGTPLSKWCSFGFLQQTTRPRQKMTRPTCIVFGQVIRQDRAETGVHLQEVLEGADSGNCKDRRTLGMSVLVSWGPIPPVLFPLVIITYFFCFFFICILILSFSSYIEQGVRFRF